MQSSLQTLFFQHIKGLIPVNISMVEEVAEILGISTDSAYRRIRGEKSIALEEVQKLCGHFKISMDFLMNLQSDAFIFTGDINSFTESNFEEWLNHVLQQFTWLNHLENKQVYFLVKDIPPFLHFQIPELTSFKFYFWMKSLLFNDSFKGVKFRIDDPRFDKFHVISKKIAALYNNVPITEIWNIESINSTLQQISFYHETGAFENKSDVILLYSKVEELINHAERQAELGIKFALGHQPGNNAPEYQLFVNELTLGDNTLLVESGNTRVTFLNHSLLYFISTRDEKFNAAMYRNLENLMKKSTHISSVGEKERHQFFNRMRASIHSRIKAALAE